MFDFIIYGFESAIILELLKIIYFTLQEYAGIRQQMREFIRRLKEVSLLEVHF